MSTSTAPPTTADDYDVAAVRAQFPALGEGFAHFEGPGGTQLPASVSDAVAASMRRAVSNVHSPFPSSHRADAAVDDARAAIADLTGAEPGGVVLGPAMTPITYVLSRALAAGWGPGDEVVVSRLDHDANVRPWVQAAAMAGATVRWLEVDPATGELPLAQLESVLTARTRLVAVTAASNVLGTRPDVRAIADAAHAVGALVHVDGVAATPHLPVDVTALGADFYACSIYKFYGPHLAATVASPQLLEQLHPDKLLPSDDTVPARFEPGTPPFEVLVGLTAAVEHLAARGTGATRRERVLSGQARVQMHEERVFAGLLAGLAGIDGVSLVGRPARRVPTVAFTVAGRTPREVSEGLAAQGVCVGDGDFYAVELVRALGLAESGGVVRAGVVAYTDDADVARLVAGISGLVR